MLFTQMMLALQCQACYCSKSVITTTLLGLIGAFHHDSNVRHKPLNVWFAWEDTTTRLGHANNNTGFNPVTHFTFNFHDSTSWSGWRMECNPHSSSMRCWEWLWFVDTHTFSRWSWQRHFRASDAPKYCCPRTILLCCLGELLASIMIASHHYPKHQLQSETGDSKQCQFLPRALIFLLFHSNRFLCHKCW